MKHKIFYGNKPKLTAKDKPLFSRGNYECKALLKNRKGEPVAISQSKDLSIWKVEHNFSCVVFDTYDEVIAYCKGRFSELDEV